MRFLIQRGADIRVITKVCEREWGAGGGRGVYLGLISLVRRMEERLSRKLLPVPTMLLRWGI
jgi:hypothetical protein